MFDDEELVEYSEGRFLELYKVLLDGVVSLPPLIVLLMTFFPRY
jgi:hypothetical protein